MRWIFIFVMLLPSVTFAQNHVFEFSASACTTAIKYGTPAEINSVYQNGALTTIIEVPINCAYASHKPTYKINQNIVEFNFETFSPGGETARCVCKHVIKFKLTLDQKKYSVKVKMNGKYLKP